MSGMSNSTFWQVPTFKKTEKLEIYATGKIFPARTRTDKFVKALTGETCPARYQETCRISINMRKRSRLSSCFAHKSSRSTRQEKPRQNYPNSQCLSKRNYANWKRLNRKDRQNPANAVPEKAKEHTQPVARFKLKKRRTRRKGKKTEPSDQKDPYRLPLLSGRPSCGRSTGSCAAEERPPPWTPRRTSPLAPSTSPPPHVDTTKGETQCRTNAMHTTPCIIERGISTGASRG